MSTSSSIIASLGALRTQAPRGFVDDVLARAGLADSYVRVRSAVGAIFVAYGDRGVTACDLATDAGAFERDYRTRCGRPVRASASVPRWIDAALHGRTRVRADLDRLPPFQRAVLRKAAEIPAGEVRSYEWIAREIGAPRAARAVGTALGRNPIPVLVPCHRVVRGDGTLGGYGLGLPRKRAILKAEGVDVDALPRLMRAAR